jgi:site-specific recombinase XerD
MTNKVLVNRFLAHLRREGKSINTLSAYATDLKQLLAYLANTNFSSKQTPKELKNYSTSLSNLAPNSQARKLTSAREFLSWLNQKGYLQANLSQTISLPKRNTRVTTKPLSPHQISRLRREADSRERLVLELILQTGMKLHEVTSLRMKDIELSKSYILHPTTDIQLPLTDPLKQALDYYLAAHSRGPRSTLLASTRTGRELTPRTASNILAHLSQRAGVKNTTPKNLRTTFIVRQLKARTPIATVSEIVGHGSLATTQKYLKLVSGSRKKIKAELAEV